MKSDIAHEIAEIDAGHYVEQNLASVQTLMDELKLDCHERDFGRPQTETNEQLYKNVDKDYFCEHEYGLMFGQNKWIITYSVEKNGTIRDGRSILTCPSCQGF